MKRLPAILLTLALTALACNLPFVVAPPAPATSTPVAFPTLTPAPIPSAEIPGNPTAAPTYPGQPASYEQLTLVLPSGIATGASGQTFPPAEGDAYAPWDWTPGHIELTLDGYALQNTFHQPRIRVYPAKGFADLNNGAATSIERLQAILANPGAPIPAEALPFVPFFNAGAQMTSKAFYIPFQNGAGVRFLTQYGQDVGPITNEGLFYHFQGLTTDGEYYVIVILPIHHPSLPETYDSPLPDGGLPFPVFGAPIADFESYYNGVSDMLDITLAGAFAPHLENLDYLVQSIRVGP